MKHLRQGLCDLPIATPRLYEESEEVWIRSCTRNRVFMVDCEFPNYDFVITREKNTEDKRSVPEFIQNLRGIVSGFDKTNRNTFFNHSISAHSPSTVSFLTTTAHSISKKTQSYLTLVKLTPMAKNELLWWANDLELRNGRMVMQPQAQVLIQTDASKKGWRTVCRGIRTGVQWSKKEQDLHINQLELLAIKLAILTFAKIWKYQLYISR